MKVLIRELEETIYREAEMNLEKTNYYVQRHNEGGNDTFDSYNDCCTFSNCYIYKCIDTGKYYIQSKTSDVVWNNGKEYLFTLALLELQGNDLEIALNWYKSLKKEMELCGKI